MSKNSNTKRQKLKKILSDLNIRELKPLKKFNFDIVQGHKLSKNQIKPFVDCFFEKLDVKLYMSHHTRGIISPVIAEVSNTIEQKYINSSRTLPKFGDVKFDYLINEISMGFVEDIFQVKK